MPNLVFTQCLFLLFRVNIFLNSILLLTFIGFDIIFPKRQSSNFLKPAILRDPDFDFMPRLTFPQDF